LEVEESFHFRKIKLLKRVIELQIQQSLDWIFIPCWA